MSLDASQQLSKNLEIPKNQADAEKQFVGKTIFQLIPNPARGSVHYFEIKELIIKSVGKDSRPATSLYVLGDRLKKWERLFLETKDGKRIDDYPHNTRYLFSSKLDALQAMSKILEARQTGILKEIKKLQLDNSEFTLALNTITRIEHIQRDENTNTHNRGSREGGR